jgi:gliding motility-associated-like protein
MGTPVDCSNGTTSIFSCDDGDPCTINDEQTVLDSDGTICIPCAGIAIDCSTGPTSVVPCDDGDANTVNDMQTILDCDGSVCVPCMGEPVDCSNGTTTEQPCDDGDACTENDMETVLDSDGTICVPCSGTPIDCNSMGATTDQPCDDGDPFTINDMETILDCDGSICIPCMGEPVDCSNGTTTVVSCDDGDPCTMDDEETILDSDGTVCIPCAGVPVPCGVDGSCEQSQPCDDGDPCTINDVEVILLSDGSICQPCTGTQIDELEAVVEVLDENCEGDADGVILIDGVVGGTPPYLYALNSDVFTMDEIYTNLIPGSYSLIIQDNNGCESQTDIFVGAANALTLELGNDEMITLGDSIQFSVVTNMNIDSIIWEFDESLSCLDCLEPYAQPINQTTYTLTLIDENGCQLSDQITVMVDKTRRVYIPNAFSPNDDGLNDLFMIYGGSGIKMVHSFNIYDRWGVNVFSETEFQPNDTENAWNGTFKGELLNPGIFAYFAEIEFSDGRRELFTGEILLIR